MEFEFVKVTKINVDVDYIAKSIAYEINNDIKEYIDEQLGDTLSYQDVNYEDLDKKIINPVQIEIFNKVLSNLLKLNIKA